MEDFEAPDQCITWKTYPLIQKGKRLPDGYLSTPNGFVKRELIVHLKSLIVETIVKATRALRQGNLRLTTKTGRHKAHDPAPQQSPYPPSEFSSCTRSSNRFSILQSNLVFIHNFAESRLHRFPAMMKRQKLC